VADGAAAAVSKRLLHQTACLPHKAHSHCCCRRPCSAAKGLAYTPRFWAQPLLAALKYCMLLPSTLLQSMFTVMHEARQCLFSTRCQSRQVKTNHLPRRKNCSATGRQDSNAKKAKACTVTFHAHTIIQRAELQAESPKSSLGSSVVWFVMAALHVAGVHHDRPCCISPVLHLV
jgi:hypothetical protein